MLSTYPFTPEQIEIRDLARDFARREILPFVSIYENEDISKSDLPKKISQSGVVNGRIGTDLGGLGLSLFDTGIIARELAMACSGIASLFEASELAITTVLVSGSKEQKERYLLPLLKESSLAGFGLFYGDNSDTDSSLTVKQEGETTIVNGVCPLVLNADFCEWFILSFSSEHLIVPRGIAGLNFSERQSYLGRKAADVRKVEFNNVRLEPISKIHVSMKDGELIWAQNAAIMASGCIGVAQSAFEHAVDYAKQRKTFGVPIVNHQAIAFMLAGISADIEAASMLTYQLIGSLSAENFSRFGKSTKSFVLDMAKRVTIDIVQIFGGYGYTKDYPVEKLMRDAKTYESFFGSTISLKEQLGKAMLAE
jgi:acyl-CoA dehydrogenase